MSYIKSVLCKLLNSTMIVGKEMADPVTYTLPSCAHIAALAGNPCMDTHCQNTRPWSRFVDPHSEYTEDASRSLIL